MKKYTFHEDFERIRALARAGADSEPDTPPSHPVSAGTSLMEPRPANAGVGAGLPQEALDLLWNHSLGEFVQNSELRGRLQATPIVKNHLRSAGYVQHKNVESYLQAQLVESLIGISGGGAAIWPEFMDLAQSRFLDRDLHHHLHGVNGRVCDETESIRYIELRSKEPVVIPRATYLESNHALFGGRLVEMVEAFWAAVTEIVSGAIAESEFQVAAAVLHVTVNPVADSFQVEFSVRMQVICLREEGTDALMRALNRVLRPAGAVARERCGLRHGGGAWICLRARLDDSLLARCSSYRQAWREIADIPGKFAERLDLNLFAIEALILRRQLELIALGLGHYRLPQASVRGEGRGRHTRRGAWRKKSGHSAGVGDQA